MSLVQHSSFLTAGENWLALEECSEYLDEWMPSQAYVLVVERAEEVLSEEQPDQMIAFLKPCTTPENGGQGQSLTMNGSTGRRFLFMSY